MSSINFDLLVTGAVVLSGIVASRLAEQLHLPDVILYLLVGVIAGPAGVGVLRFGLSSSVGTWLMVIGASLILYEGGREIDLRVLRRVWLSLVLLATVGVVVSMLVVGGLVAWLGGVALPAALLTAAVLAPTDPATIIPIVRQVGVARRVAQTAQAESALNDATGAVLAFVLAGLVSAGHLVVGDAVGRFLTACGVGVLVGLVVGWLAAALTPGGALRLFGRQEHGSMLALVVVLVAYPLADHFGGGGFMAAFVAGVVSGNRGLFGLRALGEHELQQRSFLSFNAMLARLAIFVFLGANVDFGLLAGNAAPAVIAVASLIVVARPATVLVSLLPDRSARWTLKEMACLFWMRETGVIPAALAGIMATDAPLRSAAPLISSSVFLAVLVTLLVQASTLPLVVRRLGILDPDADDGALA